MAEYSKFIMALLAIGVLGMATLTGASTTPTVELTTFSNSTNDTVVVAPVPFYQLDDQIKPALTIAAMAVFIIIGFIIAHFVDRWYDRKEPSENASDCSLTTRDLLKKRVALQAFQDLSEKEREALEAANDEDDGLSEVITGHKSSGEATGEDGGAEGGKELMKAEDKDAAEKATKFWMFKTAFMGKKRKRDPEAVQVLNEPAKPKEDAKQQKIFTLPNTGKESKPEANTTPKNKEFIDVQFTHHRVEESFTISKRVVNQPTEEQEGENPFMYKYRHVSEDVRIPVRMMSPEAAAAAKKASKERKDMGDLGYYAELALAPTRLGHYADSDFSSTTSLERNNKTNNNHEPEDASEKKEDTWAAPPGEISRRKSPSPTKVHFSPTSGSPTKAPAGSSDGFYDDDFESISTNDHHGSTKRIRTGKTDKTEYSYASGPTVGTSLPSVGTINTGTSADTKPDNGVLSARRQVDENAAATAAGTKSKEQKVEKPQQFSKSSTKDKGKAKKITVQPRI